MTASRTGATEAPGGSRWPLCAFGCGVVAIPILAMNRGREQKSMEPTHTIGCPACGRTWAASKTETMYAERAERGYDAKAERERKDAILRARLAAAPKVGR